MKFLILLILVGTLADFGKSDEPPDPSEYINEKDECIKVGDFIEDCNKCECAKIGEPKSCSKMICSRNPYPGPAPPSKPKPTTKRTTKKPTTTKKLKPTTTKKQNLTTTKKQNPTTTKKKKPNTTRKENNHDTTTKKNKSLKVEHIGSLVGAISQGVDAAKTLKELFSGGQGEVHAATEEPVVEGITEGSTDQPIDQPIDQS